MAETTITKESISRGTALTPTEGTAANGDGSKWLNTGREYLRVEDTGTGGQTVTVDSRVNCNQEQDHNSVTTVAINSVRLIGPFPKDRFNDTSGFAHITFSGVVNLAIDIVGLPPK